MGDRGTLIYRHWPSLERATIYLCLIGYSFLLFIVMALEVAILSSSDLWEDPMMFIEDPVVIASISIGTFLLLSIVWVPFLFFPNRFGLTSEGIIVPTNRYHRITRRRPDFIRYGDIDVIYPQFIPAPQFVKHTIKGDVFQSMIVVTKDGKNVEIRWNPYNYTDENDRYKEFREFLSKTPGEFGSRWSDTPVPTGEDLELIRDIRSREGGDGVKIKLSRKDKINLTGFSISFVILFVGMMGLMLTKEGFSDETHLIWIMVFVFVFGIASTAFFGIRIGRNSRKDIRARGMMHLMDTSIESNIRKDKKALDRNPFKLEMDKMEEGRPYDRKRIEDLTKPIPRDKSEKAAEAVANYKPGLGILSIFIIIGILIGCFVPIFFDIPFLIAISSIIIGVILALGIMTLIIVKTEIFSIDMHKEIIRQVYAEEVRTGKRVLPEDFRSRVSIGITRGGDPLIERDLEKIRKWGRMKNRTANRIIIGTIIAIFPVTIPMMVIMAVLGVLETIPGLIFAFVVPMGMFIGIMYFALRRSTVLGKITLYTDWERRTGLSVLPGDIRAIQEDMEEKAEKTQVGKILEKTGK
ncbi:MAG: hypothetical protein ACMUIG_10260 [Thermoplasmatota archaeon]